MAHTKLIVLMQVGNVMADITERLPSNTIDMVTNRIERTTGDFVASDLSLTVDNTDNYITDALRLNSAPKIEMYYDVVTPQNQVFVGKIAQETLIRTGKYKIEVMVLSPIKWLEQHDVKGDYYDIGGNPTGYINKAFSKIGIPNPHVNIPMMNNAYFHDWNFAGQKAVPKNFLEDRASEFQPYASPSNCGNNTYIIGIIALAGGVYYVKRQEGNITLEDTHLSYNNNPITSVSRIWYAPCIGSESTTYLNRFYLIIEKPDGFTNYITIVGVNATTGLLVVLTPYLQLPSDTEIKPDAICVNPSRYYLVEGITYQHVIIIVGRTIASDIYSVWFLMTAGWTIQTTNLPIKEHPAGTNCKEWYNNGAGVWYVLVAAQYDNQMTLYAFNYNPYYLGYAEFGEVKGTRWIGVIQTGDNLLFISKKEYFYLNDLIIEQLFDNINVVERSNLVAETIGSTTTWTYGFNFLATHPLNINGNDKTFTYVEARNTDNQIELAYKKISYNANWNCLQLEGNLSDGTTCPTLTFTKTYYTLPEKVYDNITPPFRDRFYVGYNYQGVWRQILTLSPLAILFNQEKNDYMIFNIWQAQTQLYPNIFIPRLNDNELTYRDLISQIANAFGCNCLVTGLKNRFEGFYQFFDGVFSRFINYSVVHPIIKIDDDPNNENTTAHQPTCEVEIYDGVKLTAFNNESFYAGTTTTGKKILAISSQYMTPAWARVLVNYFYDYFNNNRIFKISIPVSEYNNEFIGRILGKVNLLYYGESIQCQIIESSLRRDTNMINMTLKEIINGGSITQNAVPGNSAVSIYDSVFILTKDGYSVNLDMNSGVGLCSVVVNEDGNKEITFHRYLVPALAPINDSMVELNNEGEFRFKL